MVRVAMILILEQDPSRRNRQISSERMKLRAKQMKKAFVVSMRALVPPRGSARHA
jgi:hypothetical protein